MSASDQIADRLRFAEIDAATRETLAAFLPALKQELPPILRGLYQHISQTPDIAAMFPNPASMDHAREAQITHWTRLFEARFDEDYVASVRRIGLVHARIGLEPRWYIAGYSYVLSRVYEVACRIHGSRLAPASAQVRTGRLMAALNRVVMLDMDLAISTYLEENKAAYDRRLASVSAAFEAQVTPVVSGLAGHAESLSEAAMVMSASAAQATAQAAGVAEAAEVVSGNVQTVASATEEMHSSAREIGRQVVQSSDITRNAVTAAAEANRTMSELAEAAERIGDVTNLISDIAARTNLLALNATIEAARAGDAGRGFSVVASEVKSLAAQTARATEQITSQITTMQHRTDGAVAKIKAIAGTVETISAIATAIAAAVEQQEAATQEITRSIHETAQGTDRVSSNIAGVSDAASDTANAAERVRLSSDDLRGQAEGLQRDVRSFLLELRAA